MGVYLIVHVVHVRRDVSNPSLGLIIRQIITRAVLVEGNRLPLIEILAFAKKRIGQGCDSVVKATEHQGRKKEQAA